jgi:hypothetical protein
VLRRARGLNVVQKSHINEERHRYANAFKRIVESSLPPLA